MDIRGKSRLPHEGQGDSSVVYVESNSSLAMDLGVDDAAKRDRSEGVLLRGEFGESSAGQAGIPANHKSHHSFLRGKVKVFGHFVPLQSLALGLVEGTLFFLIASFVLTRLPADRGNFVAPASLGGEWATAGVITLVLLAALAALGLYSAHQRAELGGVITRTVVGFGGAGAVLLFLHWVIPGLAGMDPATLGITLLGCLAGFSLLRPLYYGYIDGALLIRRVLVVGTGTRAQSIERLRRRSDHRGFQLVGFVSLHPDGHIQVKEDKIVHLKSRLCDYALDNDIDEIVVALDDRRQGNVPTDELLNCRMSGMDVTDILDFFERETGKIRLDLLRPSWLIHSDGFRHNWVRDFAKRVLDLVLGFVLFVVGAPFMLATALAVWIESGGKGPVLYRQERVGKGGKPFELLKFRSMRVDAEKDGKARWAQENDPRVTLVGGFIRKMRLDELPQLWNVLRGEMSMVGPRPERPAFVAELSELHPLYSERHRVKPGITGWAQIRYPYGASKKDSIEKLQYDLYYVKNHRLVFDLYILMQTVEVVLFKVGSR